MPLYGQWSGSPRRFNALSRFNLRLDSPAPGAIYTPCFCMPFEAARTINLRSSRSKRLATVRNSYANSSKAALVSSSLVRPFSFLDYEERIGAKKHLVLESAENIRRDYKVFGA
jgi:hypothetical protein